MAYSGFYGEEARLDSLGFYDHDDKGSFLKIRKPVPS